MRHGQKVRFETTYGTFQGSLVLPPLELSGPKVATRIVPQRASVGIYGVYTITLEGGRLFRSEGRIYPLGVEL